MPTRPLGVEIENADDHRLACILIGLSLCRPEFNRTVVPDSYERVRKVFTADDLPALYQALDDDGLRSYWYRIAEVIGYLSNRPDPKSAEILLRYAKRNDGWELLSDPKRQRMAIMGKVRALEWVGLVGGAEYYEALKNAMSHEGAAALTAEWINAGPLPGSWGKDPERLIGLVQGRAAMGLVYSGDPQNVAAVREAYETVAKMPMSLRRNSHTWSGLASAMAMQAYIQDHGLESYLKLQGDARKLVTELGPYLNELEKRLANPQ